MITCWLTMPVIIRASRPYDPLASIMFLERENPRPGAGLLSGIGSEIR